MHCLGDCWLRNVSFYIWTGLYSYLWLPFLPLIVSSKPETNLFSHILILGCWFNWRSSGHLLWILQVILLVGTKLLVIITQMGLRIQERGDVVRGAPVVQPGDDLFWFGNPRFILFLIHLVLFQVSLTSSNFTSTLI